MADEVQGVLVEHVVPGFVREPEAADLLQGLVHIHERIGAGKDEAVGKAVIGGFDLNTPPAKAGGFTVATKVAFRLKPVWPLLKQAEVIPPQFGRFHLHLPVA